MAMTHTTGRSVKTWSGKPSTVGRAVAAAGVFLSADVHLVLYFSGMSSVSVVGPAFMLNAIGGMVIGFLLLLWRHWLPLLAAIGFGMSTLAAFYISATVGLFGVHETLSGNQQVLAQVAEWMAVIAAGLAWLAERRASRS